MYNQIRDREIYILKYLFYKKSCDSAKNILLYKYKKISSLQNFLGFLCMITPAFGKVPLSLSPFL